MSVRFTVTGSEGAISFNAPAYAIKMFVAACARGPETASQLLEFAKRFDPGLVRNIQHGLNQFDEHNLHDDTRAFESTLEQKSNQDLPPFRIYNETTRHAASQPGRIGSIVLNLNERRIVQIQNSYSEIQRSDRGRLRKSGEPTRMLYHYTLPSEWAIVP